MNLRPIYLNTISQVDAELYKQAIVKDTLQELSAENDTQRALLQRAMTCDDCRVDSL